MRTLITGATGFLGSHLARRQIRDGHEVHLVVRPTSAKTAIADLSAAIHVHDGTTDQLVDIVATSAPDVCFHLASGFVAEHRRDQIDAMVRDNLGFGTQLLQALGEQGCTRLVSAGTSWQHFQGADYDPVCLYAAMKKAFEDLATFWVSARGLSVVVLRFFDTYGPMDRRGKLFAALDRAAADATPLAMSGGDQLIDLVYVDDVIDALDVAGQRVGSLAPRLESFGVSSGAPIPLRQVVAEYSAALGTPIPVDWGARPYREREVMVPWHGEPALPDWSPSVPLAEGLRRMVAHSV